MTTIKSNEFHAVFALSKTKMFNVNYYTLRGNANPHFSTTAEIFNRPKTDWSMGGQCQDDVLIGYGIAKSFYEKWDVVHTKQLTQEQYNEMINDLEKLFVAYPYLLEEKSEGELLNINFRKVKDFSMKVYRSKKQK